MASTHPKALKNRSWLLRWFCRPSSSIALLCAVSVSCSDREDEVSSAQSENATAPAITEEANSHPSAARTDLSVRVGGGQGVLISPHWVMTASHCVPSRRMGRFTVTYLDSTGTKRRIMSDKVFRSAVTDIALVRLTEPAPHRVPLPLLQEGFGPNENGNTYLLRKVTLSHSWDHIPARVSKKSDGKRFYISKKNRKGKAGTSGSPWVLPSECFGEVLVGITHGTGRVPQVGTIWRWIDQTVTENSKDELRWITPQQALKKRPSPP